MSYISKVMQDKDSFDFHGHSNGILPLPLISVHCLEKWELTISAFGLKLIINLFSWKIGGITGMFLLFKNFFNMDQNDISLVLGSKNFLLPLNSIYFSK